MAKRAQLHVREHRTAQVYSRSGRELIRLPGLAWLREIRWPVASAILDGEAVAGDGSEGILAVFEARNTCGSPMAFAVFDLLALDGQQVMREPEPRAGSGLRISSRSPPAAQVNRATLSLCPAQPPRPHGPPGGPGVR